MDYISKTREGSRVFSRKSGTVELSQANLPAAQLNGVAKVGGCKVEQLQHGITFPNVQSAIDDLTNIYQMPIDSVIAFADSANTPNGVNMIEELTVTGQASSTLIEVYGVPVPVNIGDNAVAIATKIVNVLNTYKDRGIAFKNVILKPGANDKIEVTFLDTSPHENLNYTNVALTITGATITPAKPGYGSWSKIGTGTIKDSGGLDIILHYYKRIA